MKRAVQRVGTKRWFGSDVLLVQDELYIALQKYFEEYGQCVIQGCSVTNNGDGTYKLSAGIVGLFDSTGSNFKVCRVYEQNIAAASWPIYLVQDLRDYENDGIAEFGGLYEDATTKDIINEYIGKVETVVPGHSNYLTIQQNGTKTTFRDKIQSASYRFVTDADKTNWNGKFNASEVVTNAAANKVLKLNGNARFPFSILELTPAQPAGVGGDWNNNTYTGVIYGTDIPNAPESGYVQGMVWTSDSITFQLAVGPTAVWWRLYVGSWSQWTQIAPYIQATETVKGVAEIASQAEALALSNNTNLMTPLRVSNVTGGLLKKVVAIGDWNMDASQTITKALGVEFSKIRRISVCIRDDSNLVYYQFPYVGVDFGSGYALLQGWFLCSPDGGSGSNLTIYCRVGGAFDHTDFNATSYNRGHIVVEYIP